jgi:peptidyl-prolyl cis-trans isomerase B (cyclophilin B)
MLVNYKIIRHHFRDIETLNCDIISVVGKVVMIIAVVLLGLFAVLVMNANSTNKTAPATENTLSDLATTSPSPIPVQTLSITPSETSTSSSQAETTAVIKTSKGNIELTLFVKEAPNTVKNFLSKAQSGFYVSKIFHRVEDWVVQGGDPLGNGTGGGNMPTELNNKPFIVGSLGVARGGDIKISNDSQFFITKTDASWLNGQYTNFGIVTKGMDVVNNIQINDKILGVTIQ